MKNKQEKTKEIPNWKLYKEILGTPSLGDSGICMSFNKKNIWKLNNPVMLSLGDSGIGMSFNMKEILKNPPSKEK